MPWTTLCDLDDLDDGLGKYVEIDGRGLAVFRVAGKVHAIDNACPHAGAGLYGGWVDENLRAGSTSACVVCPLHGWAFDLRTGALRGSGSDEPTIGVYPTRVFVDGDRRLVQAELRMP